MNAVDAGRDEALDLARSRCAAAWPMKVATPVRPASSRSSISPGKAWAKKHSAKAANAAVGAAPATAAPSKLSDTKLAPAMFVVRLMRLACRNEKCADDIISIDA
jgi:hypothetical protein